jgi:hypothetical protein
MIFRTVEFIQSTDKSPSLPCDSKSNFGRHVEDLVQCTCILF